MTSPPPFRVQPTDPQYLADAKAEAAFFDKPQYFSVDTSLTVPHGAPFDEHTNRRFTGEPAVRWFETLQRYATFTHGMFFGCSAIGQEARILELNPALSCTFMDISASSLELRKKELSPRFADRVAVAQTDLNFAALPESEYDVIISSSTLHHLINIEHAAYQINHALRPGGYFFLQDYVMEDRFQFSPRRQAIFEALIRRGRDRGDLPPSAFVDWPDIDGPNFSPFEAIRAEDTIEVLDEALGRVAVRGSGALNGLLYSLRLSDADAARYETAGQHLRHKQPHSLRRRVSVALGRSRRPAMSRRFQNEVLFLDAFCIDSGLLTPCNAFGVYRKRA